MTTAPGGGLRCKLFAYICGFGKRVLYCNSYRVNGGVHQVEVPPTRCRPVRTGKDNGFTLILGCRAYGSPTCWKQQVGIIVWGKRLTVHQSNVRGRRKP